MAKSRVAREDLPPVFWKTKDAAAFAGVCLATYRARVLSLKNHPKPILGGVAFHAEEIVSFLNDPANLR